MAYQKLLDAMAEIRKYVESEGDFKYTNKRYRAKTFAEAKKKTHYINCVQSISWGLRMTGDLDTAHSFYGNKGKIVWQSDTKAYMKKKGWSILSSMKGMTVSSAIKKGLLQPGDIVMYQSITHTNMYAGGEHWYDSGHAYSSQSGELAAIKKMYGKTVYGGQKISYVLRKTSGIEPEKTTKYRVQVGAFETTSALEQMAIRLKDYGFTSFSEKGADGMSRLYCGSFTDKAKAEKRVAALKKKGVSAFIVEV